MSRFWVHLRWKVPKQNPRKFPNKFTNSGITISESYIFWGAPCSPVVGNTWNTHDSSGFVGGQTPTYLGEAVVFGVSGVVLVYEYQRSKARFGYESRSEDFFKTQKWRFDEQLKKQLGGLDSAKKNMSDISGRVENHYVFF